MGGGLEKDREGVGQGRRKRRTVNNGKGMREVGGIQEMAEVGGWKREKKKWSRK